MGDLVLLQKLDVVIHGPVLEKNLSLNMKPKKRLRLYRTEMHKLDQRKDFVTSRLMVERKALFGLMMIFCTSCINLDLRSEPDTSFHHSAQFCTQQ